MNKTKATLQQPVYIDYTAIISSIKADTYLYSVFGERVSYLSPVTKPTGSYIFFDDENGTGIRSKSDDDGVMLSYANIRFHIVTDISTTRKKRADICEKLAVVIQMMQGTELSGYQGGETISTRIQSVYRVGGIVHMGDDSVDTDESWSIVDINFIF